MMKFIFAAFVLSLSASLSQADIGASSYQGIPDCPSYFIMPFKSCRYQGRDAGFCYNPSAMVPGKEMQLQEANFECLTGAEMGFDGETERIQCPADKPQMCRFAGTNGEFANKIMYVDWLAFPGTIIAYSIFANNKANTAQAREPRTEPLLAP